MQHYLSQNRCLTKVAPWCTTTQFERVFSHYHVMTYKREVVESFQGSSYTPHNSINSLVPATKKRIMTKKWRTTKEIMRSGAENLEFGPLWGQEPEEDDEERSFPSMPILGLPRTSTAYRAQKQSLPDCLALTFSAVLMLYCHTKNPALI